MIVMLQAFPDQTPVIFSSSSSHSQTQMSSTFTSLGTAAQCDPTHDTEVLFLRVVLPVYIYEAASTPGSAQKT